MVTIDLINWLSVIVLLAFIVALFFLIALLYRANKALAKIDHLSDTFQGFVRDIVPAIVNIGTITTAVHSIIRSLTDQDKKKK